MHNIDRISCPVLYLIGGNDDYRFRADGKQLIEALRARGVLAEYSEHPDMEHGFYWGREEPPRQQFYDALKITTAFINDEG